MKATQETVTLNVTFTWWNNPDDIDAVRHLDQITHELELVLIRNADNHVITWPKEAQ